MDQLPIILVSNDLKYAMTPLKIKTFQRARQYYYTQRQALESGELQIQQLVGVSDKLEKVKKYMQKYDAVREDVWRKVNFCSIDQTDIPQHTLNDNFTFTQREVFVPRYEDSSEEEGQEQEQEKMPNPINERQQKKQPNFTNSRQSQENPDPFDFEFRPKLPALKQQWSMPHLKTAKRQSTVYEPAQIQEISKAKNLFQKSMLDNSIVQIYGEKSVGKTALLLYFCEQYAQSSPKKIYFINCGGGVTYRRYERLERNCPNLEYRDCYSLEQHVLAVCRAAALDAETGCVAVDSLTNLLMQQEKTLIFLIKMFKVFAYLQRKGCKVILTNYLQQSFDHHNQDPLTNHYSYYSAVTSEFVTYKYFLMAIQNTERVAIKMCRGGFVEAQYQIGDDGVGELEVKTGERQV